MLPKLVTVGVFLKCSHLSPQFMMLLNSIAKIIDNNLKNYIIEQYYMSISHGS